MYLEGDRRRFGQVKIDYRTHFETISNKIRLFDVKANNRPLQKKMKMNVVRISNISIALYSNRVVETPTFLVDVENGTRDLNILQYN